MALEDVMNAIVDKAREEAKAMQKEAKARGSEALDRAREEAAAEGEERLAAAERDLRARFDRERSSLRFAASRDALMVEKEMLDELHARFTDAVAGLSAKEHEGLLKTLLEEACTAMPEGAVSVCPRDTAAAKKVLKAMKGYTLGPEVDCLGGAVVTAPDGERSLDLRYETALEEVWKERMHDISGRLFRQADGAGPPADVPGGGSAMERDVVFSGEEEEEDWNEEEDKGEDEEEDKGEDKEEDKEEDKGEDKEEDKEEDKGEDKEEDKEEDEEISSGMVSWE